MQTATSSASYLSSKQTAKSIRFVQPVDFALWRNHRLLACSSLYGSLHGSGARRKDKLIMIPARMVVAITLILAWLISACAPVAPASGDVAAREQKISLLVWDQFSDAAQGEAAEQVYASFMETHPNIEIKREVVPYAQLIQTGKTALASGTGPDLVYYDTGIGYAGVLTEAGLLAPLDDIAKDFGWDKRIFPWALARSTFDGHLYGLGMEMEFIGMYFNQTLLEQEGLEVPETDQELLEFCAQAQEKGYIPIAFGNNPGWQSYHQFGMVANNALGSDEITKLLVDGEGSWDRPELEQAVQFFFVDLLNAGCFTPDVNAVGYDDANSLFFTGKALLHTTGTWLIGDIDAGAQGYEIGMAPFPSLNGGERLLPSGLGSAWFISAKSQHPEEAAMLLDHIMSDASVQLWVEGARFVPPVIFDASSWSVSPLMKFAIETMQAAGQGEPGAALGHYVDPNVPEGFNAMMQDGFQAVLAGIKTPAEQLADLQRAWEEGR
jgi:raffinose/stachyose/melibiose transport system substrate-binding protein